MEIVRYNADCECKAFKCAADCQCAHKTQSDKTLEGILNEMLSMSGLLPEPQPEPEQLNIEAPVINDEVEQEENIVTDIPESTNSIWVPVEEEIVPPRRQTLITTGNSFNQRILAFNAYANQKKRQIKPESPAPGAPYPCRLQFENIQADLRLQEEIKQEKINSQEKKRKFEEAVRGFDLEMEQMKRSKPVFQSPFRPPIYPCPFEFEGRSWNKRTEMETQQKLKEQAEFDKRVEETNREMMRMTVRRNAPPPQSYQFPAPVPVATISKRQVLESAESRTRELFSNENMRKYNTWSKPCKPQVPQRESGGSETLLPSTFHQQMATYVQNCEFLENVKRERLKDMFRGAYKYLH